MYLEFILKGDREKRIVWFDEGLAQLFSGETDHLEDEAEFKKFFENVKAHTKRIPDIKNLDHGESFMNDEYNMYDIGYLIARYLKETLSAEDFRSLIGDFDKIKEYGTYIVPEMFEYYSKKLESKTL